MPIREMAAICRNRCVPVMVDGAHAPGQIPLGVPALGVDWYVGNLQKWAFAPKGTAVLWCASEQHNRTHWPSRMHLIMGSRPSSITQAPGPIRIGSRSQLRSVIWKSSGRQSTCVQQRTGKSRVRTSRRIMRYGTVGRPRISRRNGISAAAGRCWRPNGESGTRYQSPE